ncbi:UbiA prenyltransferase family protein [Mangrovimonas xylaniphaga]|uniref:hypothetical protein n=1 Tax=Mangrovimonas xylaniphaga TaxID=1645915 RepID=UPI0006B678B9|nr:hypothetical protein [Mangrovimonas xylaniphaga]
MRFLKRIFNFYINSSIHVALAVYAISWITLMEYNLPYDETVLYFIFYASITGYNFVKFFGLAKFHHRSLAYWLKFIQVFSFVCFLLMCFYAARLELKTLLYIAFFGAVTFLYAVPFLPRKMLFDKNQNLRSISGIKVYVIAMVWAGVTVLLPLLNADYPIGLEELLPFLQRFILVLVLILPFEIRDLNYDSLKLSTIPQKIGVKRTKIFGGILLLVMLGLELIRHGQGIRFKLSLLVVSLVLGAFLYFASKNQRPYYCSFWVEGIPIFWLLLLLVT